MEKNRTRSGENKARLSRELFVVKGVASLLPTKSKEKISQTRRVCRRSGRELDSSYSGHQPHVATEPLKCSYSQLISAKV